MAKGGERDIELSRSDAIAMADWLQHHRPRPQGLAFAYVQAPPPVWLVDPAVQKLSLKFRRHAARKNSKPSIRLTIDELRWFDTQAPRGGMFGRGYTRALPAAVSIFCMACRLALLAKRGAPTHSARMMIVASKIERTNGADGKRSERRIRQRIERAREMSDWAKGYDGLGAVYMKSFIQEFD